MDGLCKMLYIIMVKMTKLKKNMKLFNKNQNVSYSAYTDFKQCNTILKGRCFKFYMAVCVNISIKMKHLIFIYLPV